MEYETSQLMQFRWYAGSEDFRQQMDRDSKGGFRQVYYMIFTSLHKKMHSPALHQFDCS